jgi:hypothetical protein
VGFCYARVFAFAMVNHLLWEIRDDQKKKKRKKKDKFAVFCLPFVPVWGNL